MDADLVTGAVGKVLKGHPHWAQSAPPGWGDNRLRSGATAQPEPEPLSWSSVLRPPSKVAGTARAAPGHAHRARHSSRRAPAQSAGRRGMTPNPALLKGLVRHDPSHLRWQWRLDPVARRCPSLGHRAADPRRHCHPSLDRRPNPKPRCAIPHREDRPHLCLDAGGDRNRYFRERTLEELVATPLKLAGLTVCSNELVEDSDPSALQIVGDGLVRDLQIRLDAAFFGNTPRTGPTAWHPSPGSRPSTPHRWTTSTPSPRRCPKPSRSARRSPDSSSIPLTCSPFHGQGGQRMGATAPRHRPILTDKAIRAGRADAVVTGSDRGHCLGHPAGENLWVIRIPATVVTDRSAYFSSDRLESGACYALPSRSRMRPPSRRSPSAAPKKVTASPIRAPPPRNALTPRLG